VLRPLAPETPHEALDVLQKLAHGGAVDGDGVPVWVRDTLSSLRALLAYSTRV
jgi:hypothetical protein